MRVGNISDMMAGCGAYMNAWMNSPSEIAATMISGFFVSNIGKATKPHAGGEHSADEVHGLAPDAVGETSDERDHDRVHDVGDGERARGSRPCSPRA